MYSDTEIKAFDIVDKFLNDLSKKQGGSVYDIKDFHAPESQLAYNILVDKQLLNFRKGYVDKNSVVDVSQNGFTILRVGGYKKYLELLQQQSDHEEYVKNLEIEKTKVDLELAKKILEEYPVTKMTARIAFIIAVVSTVLALLQLVIK